ncbi:MAG: AAA family ATPase, partial [Rhodococcus sp.]|nr:AAA family ATPase [Rhodococcus sp. (in: high G+C Gram-positive bacteria)]
MSGGFGSDISDDESDGDGLFDPPAAPDPMIDEPRPTSTYTRPDAPLAVRMRPTTLDEVVGQSHLLAPGAPLRRLVEGSGASSVMLYGPPGTGKTTLASLISGATGRKFEALSALSAGVKEVRNVIELARRRLLSGEQTVLFIDEVHRFSKTQQDALLAAVENRIVLLVAATTENPSFSVVSPLLSRSLVLQLQPLGSEDIELLLTRAANDPRGLDGAVTIAEDAMDHLVRLAAGDARRALTALEAAAGAATDGTLDLATVEASVD